MENNKGLTPRVYLWENRVLYSGPAFAPRYRCYGSSALVASLGQPMNIHRQTHADDPVTTRACLIHPGLPVYIDTGGSPLAVVFLDPMQQDFEAMKTSATLEHHGIFHGFHHSGHIVRVLENIAEYGGSPDQALESLGSIGLTEMTRPATHGSDPRLTRAIDLIRQSRTASITTENIAATISLSVPRVIQLFRQHIGVSAGRYRQWHRLHAAVLGVANGHSFTQAALGAGFSDLAHFSNTFHGMLGIMPSSPLRHHGVTRYYVDHQLATDGFTAMIPIKSETAGVC